MANLLYRASTTPTTPASTTAKLAPLTNLEVDGNFKSINDDIALKAPLVSPAFTGTPTAITAAVGTNTTQIATTAYVLAAATSTNTASRLVSRDASGNFSAGTITASLSGNASSATNLAGGSVGTVPYQSASGTTVQLAVGTTGQVLTSNGAAAPTWQTIVGASQGVFWENNQTITANYTVTAGKNAGTFGPITIADGVIVTVPNNTVWTIV